MIGIIGDISSGLPILAVFRRSPLQPPICYESDVAEQY